eukprot:gnl/TRDRNA2_/TRDRNA2_184166_c0_seq1.p1 gnl/TRDRNA2_/TRDRNA2_184166_c0~~gnl/TRDRNA2_/TRDRNA2_184166_c0_seq1.p1  ORF type:complete len:229 (+),score=56.03 gnl/TRDRNA2_/TRDRNA2_184166_c0_seq1:79-765(+)
MSGVMVSIPDAYPTEEEAVPPPGRVLTQDPVRDFLADDLWELEKACVSNDIVKVANLIESGADRNAELDKDLSTPLMIACRQGYAELVGMLVERYEVDMDGPLSRCGFRAIDYAAYHHYRFPNDVMIAEYLKSKGSQYTWWGACYGADADRLREYLDNGQDVNEVNPVLYNYNAVECAVSGGHEKIAQWLMVQGGISAIRNCSEPKCDEDLWDLGRGTAFYYKQQGIE